MEEVKLAIKPHYNKGRINKDEYNDIMRIFIPKVRYYCHQKHWVPLTTSFGVQ